MKGAETANEKFSLAVVGSIWYTPRKHLPVQSQQ